MEISCLSRNACPTTGSLYSVALLVPASALHLRVAFIAGLLLLLAVPAGVVLHKLLALEPTAAATYVSTIQLVI